MHAVEGIEGQAHSSLRLSALAVMGGVLDRFRRASEEQWRSISSRERIF
jgi:hypothetical protein